jgi:hypothetical protein
MLIFLSGEESFQAIPGGAIDPCVCLHTDPRSVAYYYHYIPRPLWGVGRNLWLII